ncbi:hypothetical protein [Streptomyces sp. RTd22]|nr:hypothetical protein [Streptomyces sp. RTd22]
MSFKKFAPVKPARKPAPGKKKHPKPAPKAPQQRQPRRPIGG